MSKFLATSLCLVLFTACSPKSGGHVTADAVDQTGQPALHAIRNEELHELMLRMDGLMHERFMTETQLDGERRKYAQRIADSAQALSQTVTTIIAKMPLLALSATEQPRFLALADRLKLQTDSLHALASHNQIDAIEANLKQVTATCSACHALFRKIGN